jgi:hypothetical protein
MHGHNIWPLIISIIAVIGTFLNAWALIKYSRRNIVFLINQLILQKAKDCNELWLIARSNAVHPQTTSVVYNDTFSEIIISIQILNNFLNTYKETGKRNFLLLQFWIQLNTSLREFIKVENNNVVNKHLPNIKNHFRQFFAEY